MADEQPSERNVNIESNVNVGTASGETTVSGVKVNVGTARDVYVQGDTAPPPSFRSVALIGFLAFLGAILINIATNQLPPGLQPYLWLAWPMALLVTAASVWVAYRQSRSAPSSITVGGTLDERNRARMFNKVENFWIKGVLEQSLYQIARLELGLELAPEKIDHPWQTVLQQASTQRAVPASTPTIQLFDDLDGKLLILGAPGAGKTTLLLELARDLIARARSDPQHPIPLVFNLTTWANKRLPLKEWLTEELNQRYDVPSKLAQAWVEADAILPLLDGLDEVAASQRKPCAEAINNYREERRLVPLAICSRVDEYAELTDKLHLQGAVVIQPLTHQNVDEYLRQVGRPLAAVRATLKDDPTLWELIDSPLLLSVVALAYKDKLVAKLSAAGTPKKRRQLFDDYIAAMFARRAADDQYAPPKITRWLSCLAHQMVSHSQTVFYIEQMQPDWLPRKRRWIPIIGVAWVSGLVFVLLFGLVGGLVAARLDGLFGGLIEGLLIGLVAGLLGGLATYSPTIESVETLQWMWSREVLLVGLAVGLLSGLGGGLGGWWQKAELGSGLLIGLLIGLLTGLLAGLFVGLSGDEIETKSVPNQGIRRSIRSALAVALLIGLLIELFVGLCIRLGFNPGGLLILGLGGVLILGLVYGGRATLQHYTLRWLLSHNGSLPLRLVPFLDYCTERIFLAKSAAAISSSTGC